MLTLTSDMQVIVIGDDEGQEDDIHVHEDILIEEKGEEVFIANPTLPWWKQRRTKIILGVMLGIVVALAVAMGIYARDLASMEAMIFDLWNLFSISFLAHDAYIYWYWEVTNNDSDSNINMS